MRVAVFGISGRTGLALLDAARARGCDLVALARPAAHVPRADHLRVRRGEFSDPDALREGHVARLVCQTGAMIGPLPRTVSRPMHWAARRFARAYPAAAADRAEQEALVQRSGLAWTLVKPPRLTDRPARRPVTAGSSLSVGLLSSVSRGALAAFLLDEIEQPRFVGQAVYVRG